MSDTPPPSPSAPANTVLIEAPPQRVFDVLVDPRTYPEWLVGAQHIRAVDDAWPAPGAQFHHRIGVGPLTVPGSTSVRRSDAPHELVLAAGMGPFGEASVRFVLEQVGDGTEVTVEEEPVRGPARLLWRGARSLVSAALWGRNAMSLSALDRLVTSGGD